MPDKSEEIKMYYAHINNMGDALNSLILEKLFERRAAPSCHIFDFDIMGIGSCLDLLITGKNVSVERQKLLSRVSDTFSMKGYIWGTGFLFKYDFKQTMLMRRNLEFVLVRGEYTRRAVSQICGREIDVPLADGGLLAPLLIADQKIEKKHDVGIIPHFQEKKASCRRSLKGCSGRQI